MSILSPTPGEVFIFRSHKRLTTNPLLGWVNTYEFEAGASTLYANLLEAANLVIDMEIGLHLSDAEFFKRVISTWVADGIPYNPASFVSIETPGLVGDRTAGDPLSLQNVLQVNRQVPTGRQGKLFYRRVLAESEIVSPAGDPVLLPVPAASLQGLLDAAQTGVAFAPYLTPLNPEGNFVMEAVGQASRYISSFEVAAAKIVKYNHRYFDRT